MIEDDIYRTSTQYRLWSFTAESLSSIRASTNSLAAAGVRAAIKNLHLSKSDGVSTTVGGDSSDTNPQPTLSREVDCLTVEEEQKLVWFYCTRTLMFGKFCDFPTNVQATAVQYLKRFYLSNSPMTYHPKEMMPSALFLATKTENHYTSLRSFAAKLEKTTAEDVVAPEFTLTQGLRFTFDLRHPQRGLEGGFMELLALASGKSISSSSEVGSPSQLQKIMLDIDPVRDSKAKTKSADEMTSRIESAHGKAKEILKTSALLTDAYFLFTPSQIWLSSLYVVDEPLAQFYVDFKTSTISALKPRLISTIQHCASLLRSSASAEPGDVEIKELTRIDKKLYKCRNPEKMDLVGINKAQKRDGDGKGEDGLDAKVIKKRKLERETSMKEAEDIFGPTLKNN